MAKNTKSARVSKKTAAPFIALSAIDTFRTEFSPEKIAERDAAYVASLPLPVLTDDGFDSVEPPKGWDKVDTSVEEAPVIDDAALEAALSVEEHRAELAAEPVELSDLEREILANEDAPASIIDHHSQLASWTVRNDEEAEDAPEAPKTTFRDAVLAIPGDVALEKAKEIAKELDERVKFQREKNPDNESIQRTLASARKELATLRGAKLLLATSVSTAFINRSQHDGSRYNVYAFGKIADLARALVDGSPMGNAINNAVVRSLFRCKKNGVTFSLEIAKAAASNKIRIDPSVAKLLVRHTVSASTAPTQASSTMQALETLGVVKVAGSRKHPTYEILDTPIAQALETICAAA